MQSLSFTCTDRGWLSIPAPSHRALVPLTSHPVDPCSDRQHAQPSGRTLGEQRLINMMESAQAAPQIPGVISSRSNSNCEKPAGHYKGIVCPKSFFFCDLWPPSDPHPPSHDSLPFIRARSDLTPIVSALLKTNRRKWCEAQNPTVPCGLKATITLVALWNATPTSHAHVCFHLENIPSFVLLCIT